MKKILTYGCLIILTIGSIAWVKRIDLMILMVNIGSDKEYANLETIDNLPWQQGPDTATTPANQRPPNVILIVADDLGFNDISTFGGGVADGQVKTPNIDQLAADGVVFGQSYSGANTCAPSRGMLMTGRYPSRTGFAFTPTPGSMGKLVVGMFDGMDNNLPVAYYDKELDDSKPEYEQQGLPTSELTIAEVLQQQGYYTAHIGKWHLGRENNMAPQYQGFDDSLLMQSGLYLDENDPQVVNAKLDFDPVDKFLWARLRYAANFATKNTDYPTRYFKPNGYLTDYWTDESIKVIKANKNRPFFLYLAHWGVHSPLQATREDYEAVGDIKPHRLRVYAAMVRALDRSIGRITQTLKEQGLDENTIVLFTSDNGGPGYIGLPDLNTPYRGWKLTSFEGGLRVPLFAKWPAKIASGQVIDTPVAHIDMTPTIAAMANASMPEDIEIDGVNLLPLLNQQGREQWQRDTLYWVTDHAQVVRHGDWKLQVNDRREGGKKTWLYDLASDPTEQYNLADMRPDKVAQLQKLLDNYNDNSVKPLYPAASQYPISIDKTAVEKFEAGDEYVLSPN